MAVPRLGLLTRILALSVGAAMVCSPAALAGNVPDDATEAGGLGVSGQGLESSDTDLEPESEVELEAEPQQQDGTSESAAEEQQIAAESEPGGSDDSEVWADEENLVGGDALVQSNNDGDETATAQSMLLRSTTTTSFDAQKAIAGWDPGFIISDRALYTSSLMSAEELRVFIQREGASCTSGSGQTCLKDVTVAKVSLTSKFAGRGYGCESLALAAGTKSWTAIKAVGDACGINPQVLLVFIQKESSGVYQAKTSAQWDTMMGMGCPDNQACKEEYKGFINQLYYAADALTSYRYRGFRYNEAVKTGKAIDVPYNSGDSSCGTSSFVMKNQATASLYTYNPAVPTASALASYPGVSGNYCDSYGQRNVYMYMWKWFPETMQDHPAADPVDFTRVPTPTISGMPLVGCTVSVGNAWSTNFSPTATVVKYQWLRNGSAISGATGWQYQITGADLGKTLTVRVTGTRSGYNTGTAVSSGLAITVKATRLAGSDRFSTNLAVNRATMESGAPVFVTTGLDYADALSIGPAVAALDGSLFLTRKDALPAESLALIAAKKPSAIYVIGGSGAVSQKVVAQLKAATGVSPTRVGGSDRYETSTKILQRFFGDRTVPLVFVATGRDFPDALTASAAGGALGAPVILVDGTSGAALSGVKDFLAGAQTETVAVAGGEAAVSERTVSALKAEVPKASTVRLGGQTRIGTNEAVNDYVTTQTRTSPTRLWVATALGFADALSAAVPAGQADSRLVLSTGQCLPDAASSWISGGNSAVAQLNVVGGPSVVGGGVLVGAGCS